MLTGIDRALELFHEIEFQVNNRKNSKIHPLSRLIVSLAYIITVLSFDKYSLVPLFGMIVYICVMVIMEDIPLIKMLLRSRAIIFILLLVGIANPVFDRATAFFIGNISVNFGWISMVTLFIKGILAVSGAYILIVQIGISGVCVALKAVHIPELMVTIVMLIYRYMIVFLQEIKNTLTAYSLRAPQQKGIHYKYWGSFVGNLLLRSMDRAQEVHNAMILRGFDGSFKYEREIRTEHSDKIISILYSLIWITIFIALRYFSVMTLVGNLIIK